MTYPSMPIKILTHRWVVRFLPDKKFSSDDQAITIPYDREIHFRRSKTNLEDIIHELTHAYLDEVGLGNSAQLQPDQMEEVYCELTSKHGFTLLLQAADIYRAYQQLKKRS